MKRVSSESILGPSKPNSLIPLTTMRKHITNNEVAVKLYKKRLMSRHMIPLIISEANIMG
jgi:hypothetical protein